MKTVTVFAKNPELKERLLVDLASLGYRVLLSDFEESDIIVADYSGLSSIRNIDPTKITLCVVENKNDKSVANAMSRIDDVIFTPYTVEELDIRIKIAMIKRGVFELKNDKNTLAIDGLVINVESYEVTIDGFPVDLTYKEYELLKYLATSRGRVYTRDQLLSTIWGYDYISGARTVDVHVRRLRSKLGRYESFIETVRNVGYRFKK